MTVSQENIQKIKCPVCGSASAKLLFHKNDDRYGYGGEFPVMKCRECQHAFLNATFTTDEMGSLYNNYYPRSGLSLADFRPLREAKGFSSWLNGEKGPFSFVPRNVTVLDIGCGFGESLGYHKARGCSVYGVEVDANILRVAEKYGFTVKSGHFDPSDYQENFFDYVTMDQVLEHVADPIDTLRGISRVLKRGGTLILSTPNVRGWGCFLFRKKSINWHIPYHMHFFSRKSLRFAAEKAGLKVTKIKCITPSSWLFFQQLHILTYPQPGVPSIFWDPKQKNSWPPGLRLAKMLFVCLQWLKVNHVITRFFDSIGLGDNFIVFLSNDKV
jgi:2-polyprenyl-3-methyl-5-hydroxy-6-metoxy-1,4-benzoquinol methylase